MPKPSDRFSASLVDAALLFHRKRLWETITPDQAVLVRIPDDPNPIVVLAFSVARGVAGSTMFCGPTAIESCRRTLASSDREPELLEGSMLLSMTLTRLETIPKANRGLLADAGFVGDVRSIAPLFEMERPGLDVREPNRTALRAIASVLKTLASAHDLGVLSVGNPIFDSELPVLRRIENPKSPPMIESGRESFPILRFELAPEFDRSELRTIRRTSERWILGFVDVRCFSGGLRDSEPDLAAVIVDADSGTVVAARYTEMMTVHEVAAILFEAMLGQTVRRQAGRPQAVSILRSEIADWLVPSLAEIEVTATHAESSSAFDDWSGHHLDEIAFALAHDIDDVPPELETEPTTLEEWKAAEKTLTTAIADHVGRFPSEVASASNWFFSGNGFEVLRTHPFEARPAFTEWFILHWDGYDGTRSLVNRWFALARSPAIRLLLGERRKDRISIFRVDSIDRGTSSLVVVDVFTNAQEIVIDHAMTESARVNWLVPLRLFTTPVGTFASIAGPSIHPDDFDQALEFLERDGNRMTPERLRAEPQRLARLFPLMVSRAMIRTPFSTTPSE